MTPAAVLRMRPAAGYGGGFGPGTTLDFTTGSLPAGVTASGATNGTRVNSSGTLVSASAPRFDYDPNTLVALGILCEPSRTNTITNSNTIDTWGGNFNVTVTANTTVAPDGTTTADSIAIGDTSVNRFARQLGIAFPNSSTGAFSAYLKSSSSSPVARLTSNNTSAWNTGLSTKFSLSSTWLRGSIAGSLGSGNAALNLMIGNTDVSGSVDGTFPSSETVVAWGGQLEVFAAGERAEASTFIFTSGSSVTRSAEAIGFTIGAGVSTLTYTFDDNSTQTKTVSAGAYTVPTNLNRARIKTIAFS